MINEFSRWRKIEGDLLMDYSLIRHLNEEREVESASIQFSWYPRDLYPDLLEVMEKLLK